MTGQHRHLFRALFLINFLITLGFGISDAFFPLYCENIGARGLLFGTAVGGYAFSKIIFSPVMGRLTDHCKRRSLVLVSLTLYLLISLAYIVVANSVVIVAMRLLQGVGCAMFRPVMQALIADHTRSEQRATVMGTFDSSFYAALSVGPILGGFIMDVWGFSGLFAALAGCCFAALTLAWHGIPATATTSGVTQPRLLPRHPLPLLRAPGMLQGLLFFILGRACGITACATFLPIFLSSKLGLSGLQVGIVMASATLTMTLLLRPFGRVSDRLPRPLLIACGALVVPLFYLFLPAVAGFSQALGVSLGIGAFSALSQPAASALLVEEGQRLGMGNTLGTFNAVLNLGFVLGPLLGSLVQSTISVQAVFVAISIVGLASGLCFVLHALGTPQTTRQVLAQPSGEQG